MAGTIGGRPGGVASGPGGVGTPGKSAYQSALSTGVIPAGTTEAQFASLSLTGTLLSRFSFGLNLPYVQNANNHPEIGYGVDRDWDTNSNWRNMEPTTQGTYDTAVVNRIKASMAAAKAAGRLYIKTLGQAPDWATGGSGSQGAGGSYNNKVPALAAWQSYLTYMGNLALSNYGPGAIWELGNEVAKSGGVQSTQFWAGTAADLVAQAQAAKTILKGIDPSCVILTPSVTASVGIVNPMMRDMLQAGIGQYVDGIAVHGYVTPLEPETIIDLLRDYRGAAAEAGYGHLPFYDTESTYASWVEVPGGPVKSLTAGNTLSEPQRASYVARRMLSGLMAGYKVQCQYGAEYSAPGSGANNFKTLALWNGSDVLNSGGKAMQTVISQMSGARIVEAQSRPRGVYALSVLLPDPSGVASIPAVWLWTRDGITVPLPAAATRNLSLKISLDGTRAITQPVESIDNEPALFVSANSSMKAINLTELLAVIEQPTVLLASLPVWTGAAAATGVTTGSGGLASYTGPDPQVPAGASSWTFTPTAGYPQINVPVSSVLLSPGGTYRLSAEVELLTAAKWRLRLVDSNKSHVLDGQQSGGTFTVSITGPGIARIGTEFTLPAASSAPAADLVAQLFLDDTASTVVLSGCRVLLERLGDGGVLPAATTSALSYTTNAKGRVVIDATAYTVNAKNRVVIGG